MRLIRYVPGPHKTHEWGEAFVEEPEDGSAPHYYHYNDMRREFHHTPLAMLVIKGQWMRAMDPDMVVDDGL